MMRSQIHADCLVADPQAILRSILDGARSSMPKKYQDGALEKRTDVKHPYWFVRVALPQADGSKAKRQPHKLGYCHDVNKQEAQRRRAALLSAANTCHLLIPVSVKFATVVRMWRETKVPQVAAATQLWYASLLDRHILPAFGDRLLTQINKQVIEAWLVIKEQGGLSWWTRNGLRGTLSAIFAAAKEWKLWNGDLPTEGVKIGKQRLVREKRLVTGDQFRSILAGVRDDTRLMLLIAALGGLRISEVLGLQWRDVDFSTGELAVNRSWYRGSLNDTEEGKRVQRVRALMGEFAKRYPGPQARASYIFIGENGKTPPDERDIARYELRPLLRQLGIYYPGFGWHAFRRMNVTIRQSVGGATALEAVKGAGHSSIDMTMLYTLTDPEREQEQVDKMFSYLMGDVKGPKQ